MRIAVDIDGILTNETEGYDYQNRTPNQENIDTVNRIYDHGHIVVLFTSRFGVDLHITKRWLKEHGVQYHKLILDKPQYDIFVDDKAYNSFKELGL